MIEKHTSIFRALQGNQGVAATPPSPKRGKKGLKSTLINFYLDGQTEGRTDGLTDWQTGRGIAPFPKKHTSIFKALQGNQGVAATPHLSKKRQKKGLKSTLINFYLDRQTDGRTDGWTDGQTDGRTEAGTASYRDAWMHLKRHGFSRWDILPTLWVRRLGFGTLFTNIILLWIRNFEKNRTTPTPKKTKKNQKKTYGFSQWDNLPTLWVWRLGFGIVLSNIFLLWIWRFGEIRTPLTPPITV